MNTALRFLLVTFALLAAWPAVSQTHEGAASDVSAYERELTQISEEFQKVLEDDGKLVDLSTRLQTLAESVLATGVELSPRLSEIRIRLEQLGPEIEQGAEPQVLQEQRAALLEERALINTLIGQLEDLSVRANTLSNDISEARRELFTSTLSRRSDISAAFGQELIDDIRDRYAVFANKIGSWVNFAWRYKSGSMVAATALSVMAALLFLVFARRYLGRLLRRDPEAVEPGYFSRLIVGFLGTLMPAAGVWLFLVLVYALYNHFSVLRDDIGQILVAVFLGVGVIYLIWQLSEAVLAPRLSQWRLVAVTDRAAVLLKLLVLVMAVTIIADDVITQILKIVGESLPITIAKSLISSFVVGLVMLAIASVRPFAGEDGAPDRPWPGWLRFLLWVTGTALIIAVSAGYIGFADFVSKQIVITGAVAATIYLGHLAAHALSREKALVHSRLGKRLHVQLEMSETAIDQLGLVLGVLLTLTLLVIGIPVLLLLWGFKWGDIRSWMLGTVTEFSVGSISISITGILAGIVVFIVGFWLTKLFQRWLDRDVLERSRVDAGVRNSVRTGIGYVGVTLAALVGVAAAGIDLSQLALVAGALSLGIGFGLQNIVSNFVSGLILLAERPFKVGDWIEAGGISGTVKAINVRATEIETFQRKSVILPNSDLINASVGNWTHHNTLGRVEVAVGVSYNSDPNQVREILMSIAEDHPRVLSNPEPYVVFVNFGESSLDFDLRVYLADINFMLTVGTEIRFAIHERFKAAGIEIPFPQRDVNLRVMGKEDVVAETGDAFGPIETSPTGHRDE
jgi:small-conductance mechanosensitive channel